MYEGIRAEYHFVFTSRETGEVILEGDAKGGNKRDCENCAVNELRKLGINYYGNDDVKLFMKKISK